MPAGSRRRSGLPIERLVVATNENDILARFVATGRYARGTVTATTSPSMDIQVASNFERLLLELDGGDAERTRGRMQAFAQSGALRARTHRCRGLFAGGSADQAEVARHHRRHPAAPPASWSTRTPAWRSRSRRRHRPPPGVPLVTLATAHPAKFPDAVEAATGRPPGPARAVRRPDDAAGALSPSPTTISPPSQAAIRATFGAA